MGLYWSATLWYGVLADRATIAAKLGVAASEDGGNNGYAAVLLDEGEIVTDAGSLCIFRQHDEIVGVGLFLVAEHQNSELSPPRSIDAILAERQEGVLFMTEQLIKWGFGAAKPGVYFYMDVR